MNTVKPATLGEKLKQRRQEKNLTIKEVETATSIRLSYLQAIEENTVLEKAPPVYAQGFIKQYAIFLDIDPDQLLREHPEVLRRKEDQAFDYGIGTLEMRNSPVSNAKWIPNAIWGGALALVILAAWYFARLLGVL